MPIQELINFRNKYPGYNDLDDATLVNSLTRKYPEYSYLRDKVGQQPRETLTPKSNVNVPLETAKGTAGYIGGRAGNILKGTGHAIMHPLKTGKDLITAAVHPVETGRQIIKSAKEDPLGFATDTALTMGAGVGISKILKGVPGNINKIKEAGYEISEKKQGVANRLNNSLIEANKKDVVYGNPGRGMASEGITGNSFKELYEKTSKRLDELNNNLDDIYNKNETVINNYSESLRPLLNARRELMKSPANNAAAIKRIDNILDDVTGISAGKLRSFYLRPVEARKFKQFIDDFIDWTKVEKGDNFINKALKKSYHTIDNIIDDSLPQSKLLNQRVTDLITAKKLIKSKINKSKVSEIMPGTFFQTISIPFKFLRSPKFKSGVASLLSKKYPKTQETEIFKKPLFRGESPSNLLSGQTKLLPSPKDVPYNPSGRRAPPFKPLITPQEKGGPTIHAGRPEMSYTESKIFMRNYITEKAGEALRKMLLKRQIKGKSK